jgi:uncharacterized protein YciI
MIVYHVAIETSADYLTRREPHRQAHIQRLGGLRAAGIVIAGGPAPDGKIADLFYRLQQAAQLRPVIEEDPYWLARAWTRSTPRSFTGFVEPWEAVPIVLDGSRRATIVEGSTTDPDMAQFALIEMRGAGRIALAGFFEDGTTLAIAKTADADQAIAWFDETGFWKSGGLTARPFLHVL